MKFSLKSSIKYGEIYMDKGLYCVYTCTACAERAQQFDQSAIFYDTTSFWKHIEDHHTPRNEEQSAIKHTAESTNLLMAEKVEPIATTKDCAKSGVSNELAEIEPINLVVFPKRTRGPWDTNAKSVPLAVDNDVFMDSESEPKGVATHSISDMDNNDGNIDTAMGPDPLPTNAITIKMELPNDELDIYDIKCEAGDSDKETDSCSEEQDYTLRDELQLEHEYKPDTNLLLTVSTAENDYSCTCPYCSKVFKKNAEFAKHLSTHLENEIAPKNAKPSDEEVVHVPRPFKCSYCYQTFTAPWQLKRHEHIHLENQRDGNLNSSRPFQCKKCGKRTCTEKSMDIHQRRFHSTETVPETTRCQICSKLILEVNMRQHLLVHSQSRSFKCELCDRTYRQRQSLTLHIKSKHPKSQQNSAPFGSTAPETQAKCTEDVVSSKSMLYNYFVMLQNQLKQNIEVIGQNTSNETAQMPAGSLQLEGLAIVYPDSRSLYSGIHTDRPIKTELDTSSSTSVSTASSPATSLEGALTRQPSTSPIDLKVEPVDGPPNAKSLKCRYCDESFSKPVQLKRHKCVPLIRMREVPHPSNTIRPFQCRTCGKRTITAAAMKIHKRRFHGVELDPQTTKCETCEKLILKINLRQHLLVHSQLRSHKCDYCERTYKHKSSLNAHESRKHSCK